MMGRGYGYGYNNMMGGYGWFGGLLMLAFGALVLAGIVLLIIWAVRASGGHGATGGPGGHGTPPPPGAAGHHEAWPSQGAGSRAVISPRTSTTRSCVRLGE